MLITKDQSWILSHEFCRYYSELSRIALYFASINDSPRRSSEVAVIHIVPCESHYR